MKRRIWGTGARTRVKRAAKLVARIKATKARIARLQAELDEARALLSSWKRRTARRT